MYCFFCHAGGLRGEAEASGGGAFVMLEGTKGAEAEPSAPLLVILEEAKGRRRIWCGGILAPKREPSEHTT